MLKRLFAMSIAASVAASAMAVSVDVQGAVLEPGSVELKQGLRLRQAIDAVGGFAANADPMAVQVIEADGDKQIVDLSKVGPTPLLQPGDRVEVPVFDASKYVTVSGAVAKPGALPYREGLTVGEVLQTAQPFDEVSAGKVKIVGADGVRTMPKGITEADLFAMTLAPGEVVRVSYPGQTFSNREILIVVGIVLLVLILTR